MTRLLLNFLFMVTLITFMSPGQVFAQRPDGINLFTRAPIPSITPSPFRLPNLTDNPAFGEKATVQSVVNFIVKWISFLGGLAAFLVVLFGGFRYITAGGNPAATDQAKRMIVGAIVGILIIALSYLVVQFIIQLVTQLR